jgi:3-methyl-2-oxobutanoate hydroxymethyltransferase
MSHQTLARQKKTRMDLQAAADGGERLVAVTAYDAPTALIADAAGVDIILVGDSVGNVCLGFENTLPVTMAMMRHHLEAVARARPSAFLMAALPFMSYHAGVEGALKNAGRLVRAGAQAVKLEGAVAPVARALADAGIPVMGHLGLTPQSIHAMGGHRVQCREEAQAARLLDDAKRLEAAGCFSVLLECVPLELAAIVTKELGIFTIGIGAGPHCSGQVLVFHDVLGLSEGPCPRFVRKYMDSFGQMTAALQRWSGDVKNGVFPGGRESYNLTEAAREGLAARFPGEIAGTEQREGQ